jgi:hypothetical protein
VLFVHRARVDECLGKLTEEQLRELADVWTAVGLAEAPDTSYGA